MVKVANACAYGDTLPVCNRGLVACDDLAKSGCAKGAIPKPVDAAVLRLRIVNLLSINLPIMQQMR
jgi:hypothetical protein